MRYTVVFSLAGLLAGLLVGGAVYAAAGGAPVPWGIHIDADYYAVVSPTALVAAPAGALLLLGFLLGRALAALEAGNRQLRATVQSLGSQVATLTSALLMARSK